MTEKPIIFNGEMVRAILDGRKSQTRRVLKCAHKVVDKATPHDWNVGKHPSVRRWEYGAGKDGSCHLLKIRSGSVIGLPCPYGQPGGRLWVRETWAHDAPDLDDARRGVESCGPFGVYYRATEAAPETLHWRPSIHMPRWASRITLEITGVRVERVRDVTSADVMREGSPICSHPSCTITGPPKGCDMQLCGFRQLWDSINAKRSGCSWEDNPWVWVVEFQRLDLANQ